MYRFKGQNRKEPEKTIEGRIVARKKGEKEVETVVEGVLDWIYTLEGLGEEAEESQVSL